MSASQPGEDAPKCRSNGNFHLTKLLKMTNHNAGHAALQQGFCDPDNYNEENIMINSKSFKLAAMALASAAIFHSANVLADGASCSDWSYNNPGCPAYIKAPTKTADATPPMKVAENNTKRSSTGTLCADWSYNDPSCPAYIRPSGQ